MQVIHFTEGATDLLRGFSALRTRFVPLADGSGDIHVTCLHLLAGADISEPSATHDCALLIVHGRVTVIAAKSGLRLDLSSGVGLIVRAGEHYSLESALGAIVLAIESERLEATLAGISTPARIAGQRWPGERDSNLKAESGCEATRSAQ